MTKIELYLGVVEHLQKKFGNLRKYTIEYDRTQTGLPNYKIVHAKDASMHVVEMSPVDFGVGDIVVRYYVGICRSCKKLYMSDGVIHDRIVD